MSNSYYQYLFLASLWAIYPRKFHKTWQLMITTASSKQLSGDPLAPFVAGVPLLPVEWWAIQRPTIWDHGWRSLENR